MSIHFIFIRQFLCHCKCMNVFLICSSNNNYNTELIIHDTDLIGIERLSYFKYPSTIWFLLRNRGSSSTNGIQMSNVAVHAIHVCISFVIPPLGQPRMLELLLQAYHIKSHCFKSGQWRQSVLFYTIYQDPPTNQIT